jgi:hypothetical protein
MYVKYGDLLLNFFLMHLFNIFTKIFLLLFILNLLICTDDESDDSSIIDEMVMCIDDTQYNEEFMTAFANVFLNVASQVNTAMTINGPESGSCVITYQKNDLNEPYDSYIIYEFNDYQSSGTVYNGKLINSIYKYGYICDPCGATSCSHCTTITGTIKANGELFGTIEYHLYGLNTLLNDSGYYIVNCQEISY